MPVPGQPRTPATLEAEALTELAGLHQVAKELHRLISFHLGRPIRHEQRPMAANLVAEIPTWAVVAYIDNTANSNPATVQVGNIHFVVPAGSGRWVPVADFRAITATQAVVALFSDRLEEAVMG
jgi:hypothetical protein